MYALLSNYFYFQVLCVLFYFDTFSTLAFEGSLTRYNNRTFGVEVSPLLGWKLPTQPLNMWNIRFGLDYYSN